MAYSNDLRQKLVEAWQAGQGTQQELADDFGVSLTWVEKVLRHWRATGQTDAPTYRHGPLPTWKPARVARAVERHPDATLAELGQRLHLSAATVCRALQRLGLPRKKSLFTPANATRHASSDCGSAGGRSAGV